MNQSDVAQLIQLCKLRARREERARCELMTKRREQRTAQTLVRVIESKLNTHRLESEQREQMFLNRLQRAPVSGRALEQRRTTEHTHAANRQNLLREHETAVDRCHDVQQACERLSARYRERRQQHEAVKTLLERRQCACERRAAQRAELATD